MNIPTEHAAELLQALKTIRTLLKGEQPKDIPGALMVANYAIANAEQPPLARVNLHGVIWEAKP